jgi:hypothetical protein
MQNDPRYTPVESAWRHCGGVPPLTRAEAIKAEALLIRAFDRKEDRSPNVYGELRPYRGGKGRRCWVSTRPGYDLSKGWARLVHDCSHRLFAHRHPSWRPHEHGHEKLELAMVQYVTATSGWLQGTLKPPAKPKRGSPERKAMELSRIDARLANWQRKAARAQRAIVKLTRRRKALLRTVTPVT